eukprot:g3704.t1
MSDEDDRAPKRVAVGDGAAAPSAAPAAGGVAGGAGDTWGELLAHLLELTEAAARIARLARGALAEGIIEEKGEAGNPRFDRDFKTLADVFIQQLFTHSLACCFPELEEHIGGEENDMLGDVTIRVGASAADTAATLQRALPHTAGAARVAAQLAAAAHEAIAALSRRRETPPRSRQIPDGVPAELFGAPLQCGRVGLWIDPIDATNEFIAPDGARRPCVDESAAAGEASSCLRARGLSVVSVLVGVYDRRDGTPRAGVVGLPFWRREDERGGEGEGAGAGEGGEGAGAGAGALERRPAMATRWRGRQFWGVCLGDGRCYHSSSLRARERGAGAGGAGAGPGAGAGAVGAVSAVSSGSEAPALLRELRAIGPLGTPPGAGFKLLCVVLGCADVYVLSKPSTYKWDTCAPHAILLALGGTVRCFGNRRSADGAGVAQAADGGRAALRYHTPDGGGADWRNSAGLVARGPRLVAEPALSALLDGALAKGRAAEQ